MRKKIHIQDNRHALPYIPHTFFIHHRINILSQHCDRTYAYLAAYMSLQPLISQGCKLEIILHIEQNLFHH